MIVESHGDLLRADAEALVNTVNTVGVMGKGIALQFKRAYPAMFDEYRRAARAQQLHLGQVQVWATGQLSGPRFVINFPTKGHWKSNSRLSDIQTGLEDLVRIVRDLEIRSIALPPLGCGNGGLRWDDVEPVIRESFKALPQVSVLLFPPERQPEARLMRTAESRPAMTLGRAALVEILARYTRQAAEEPGLIEVQKLMFFMQEAGEPLRLKFEPNRYGPYADNLRHVLKAVEGHYIVGYGDGSSPVLQAEPLRVIGDASTQAEDILDREPATLNRIQRILSLVQGFESAYGLELLATTYWVANALENDPTGPLAAEPDRDALIVARVRDWSARKARLFTPQHIQSALRALRTSDWVLD